MPSIGSNAGISLTANGTGNITLSPGATGNVGVGTTSPGSALQVAGPIATTVQGGAGLWYNFDRGFRGRRKRELLARGWV